MNRLHRVQCLAHDLQILHRAGLQLEFADWQLLMAQFCPHCVNEVLALPDDVGWWPMPRQRGVMMVQL